MLLQGVSVTVAPFGITRLASAVANCSEGPWAVALFPPAAATGLHRTVAMTRAAIRMAVLRGFLLCTQKARMRQHGRFRISTPPGTIVGLDASVVLPVGC